MMIEKLARGLFGSLILCAVLSACGGVEGDAEVEESADPAHPVGIDCDWRPTENATACQVRPGVWGITCESSNKSCGNAGKACLSSGFSPR